MIIWDIVLSNWTEIIPKVLDNTPFQIPTTYGCRGFIFYFYVQGTGTSRNT